MAAQSFRLPQTPRALAADAKASDHAPDPEKLKLLLEHEASACVAARMRIRNQQLHSMLTLEYADRRSGEAPDWGVTPHAAVETRRDGPPSQNRIRYERLVRKYEMKEIACDPKACARAHTATQCPRSHVYI